MSIQTQGLTSFLKNENKKHLIITGKKGVGKTTFIKSIMPQNAKGLITYAVWGKAKTPDCIMAKKLGSSTAKICAIPHGTRMKINADAFNDMAKHLYEIKNSDEKFVFIDEIGYIESEHENYCNAIKQLFENKNIVAVLKKEKTSLQTQILQRSDIFLLDLDDYIQDISEEKTHKLGCVIQASGHSRRFNGENKLLHILDGKMVIEYIFERLPRQSFSKILVVTRSEEIKEIAKAYNLNCVLHAKPLHSDTVKIGLEQMKNTDACMFCVADQPLCKKESYEKLAQKSSEHPENIVRLYYNDTPASPVIFPKHLYAQLMELQGETGGTPVVKNNASLIIKLHCEDEYEVYDIDSKEDFKELNSVLMN